MKVLTEVPGSALNELLEEVCLALQLTDSQYHEAEDKYTAVGRWLAASESPLAPLGPEIYAQGSMLLQTTVKPRHHDEHDVDLVCLMRGCYRLDPMAVYNAVLHRIRSNETYRSIAEPLKRCVRLNYAGQFHLDVLPACDDVTLGSSHIWVPDRRLKSWTPSNPKGFAEWFRQRSWGFRKLLAERGLEPLPAAERPVQKTPLQFAVQLLKRHRDMIFNRDGDAPKSVVLTTLAAQHYSGETTALGAVRAIVRKITAEVLSTPGILRVYNPTNSGELFSETWDLKSYQRFKDFVTQFNSRLEALDSELGMDAISRRLETLFGTDLAKRAVASLTERLSKARAAGVLGVRGSSVGLTTVASAPLAVPRNTFFGR